MRHDLTPPPGVMPIVVHPQLPTDILVRMAERAERRRRLQALADLGCIQSRESLFFMDRL